MLARALVGTLLAAAASLAESYTVQSEDSVFAVLTQRGGVAARFAHDHFIVASEFEATLEVESEQVAGFTFKCAADDLEVDDPRLQKQWSPRLTDAKLLTSPFKDISDSDRSTIRGHMLDEHQLNADAFPDIEAKLVSVKERPVEFRGAPYTHTAVLEMTVRGETVSREIAANMEIDGDRVTIEAAATLRFTDFGIEPYSAMLGAVKNLDEFFLYCFITAVPKD